MKVSELSEDLQTALEQFPDAHDWRICVASYVDRPGGEISVMYIASVHSDSDEEFFLVPEGYGEFFDLAEAPLTADELLARLKAEIGWAGFVAYTRSKVTEQANGSVVSMNMPLWGCGVQPNAELVYFYFGPGAPET